MLAALLCAVLLGDVKTVKTEVFDCVSPRTGSELLLVFENGELARAVNRKIIAEEMPTTLVWARDVMDESVLTRQGSSVASYVRRLPDGLSSVLNLIIARDSRPLTPTQTVTDSEKSVEVIYRLNSRPVARDQFNCSEHQPIDRR